VQVLQHPSAGLIRSVSRFQPDIIYQRGKLSDSVLARRICHKLDIPFIWASNSDKSGDRLKYFQSRWQKPQRWKGAPLVYAEALFVDLCIEHAIRSADLVLAQTRIQQEKLSKHFSIKAHLLRSGHPIPDYTARQSERCRVLWLANLTTIKRPLLFVRLAKACRDLDADFILAGYPADKKLTEQVRKKTHTLDNLSYTGALSLEQTDELMKTCDLFVLTSTHEGIANTFIQACKHALPTISLGHQPDHVIESCHLGAVAQTVDQWIDLVRTWICKPKRRARAGYHAYQFANRNYNIQSISDELIRYCTRLNNNKSPFNPESEADESRTQAAGHLYCR
jgi:glycosyltransferase involved in cell wall biosynthesis